jgi:hypothetical protein
MRFMSQNPVNPLEEDFWDLENMHRFQSSEPWNNLKMKSVRSLVFIHCSIMFLIG